MSGRYALLVSSLRNVSVSWCFGVSIDTACWECLEHSLFGNLTAVSLVPTAHPSPLAPEALPLTMRRVWVTDSLITGCLPWQLRGRGESWLLWAGLYSRLPERLRQEDCVFKACLGYRVN